MTTFKSGEKTVGTTWPYQVNLMAAEKPPCQVHAEAGRGHDRVVGHVDDLPKAANPNCMYLWMNYIISPEANAKVAEYFGEAPSNSKACDLTEDETTATRTTRPTRPGGRTYYWDTPTADCGDDRGEVCKPYEDWQAAWAEIKGKRA